jgi:hypothetical protein
MLFCCTAYVGWWHTASIRCGAKVRTRSERSGHAESVGSDLTKMTPTGRKSPQVVSSQAAGFNVGRDLFLNSSSCESSAGNEERYGQAQTYRHSGSRS